MIARHPDRLDWGPADADLPPVAEPWQTAWQTDVAANGATVRLKAIGRRLFMIAPPDGIAEIRGAEPPGLASALGGEPLLQVCPGIGCTAVLVDRNGGIRHWHPDHGVGPRWASGSPGAALNPIGVSGDRIVQTRALAMPAPGPDDWALEAVDPAAGRLLWTRPGRVRGLLPIPGGMVTISADGRGVSRLDTEIGETVWHRDAPMPIEEAFAFVRQRVWLRDADGGLSALDPESGEITGHLALAVARHPVGVVDARGRLNVCTGLAVATVDLVTGTVVEEIQFDVRPDVPTRAHGWNCLPVGDHHILFADMNERIFMAQSGTAGRPVQIWAAPTQIKGLAAVSRTLVVLTDDGRLTALRPLAE